MVLVVWLSSKRYLYLYLPGFRLLRGCSARILLHDPDHGVEDLDVYLHIACSQLASSDRVRLIPLFAFCLPLSRSMQYPTNRRSGRSVRSAEVKDLGIHPPTPCRKERTRRQSERTSETVSCPRSVPSRAVSSNASIDDRSHQQGTFCSQDIE
jgi:hypothetical protein